MFELSTNHFHLINALWFLPEFADVASLAWGPAILLPVLSRFAPRLVSPSSAHELAPAVAGYCGAFVIVPQQVGYEPYNLMLLLGCLVFALCYLARSARD